MTEQRKTETSGKSVTAWLGLGSNSGEMLLNLTRASLDLSSLPGTSLHAVSSIYESEPVGQGYSGPFLNAVVAVSTSMPPEKLLDHCLEIESRHGRLQRDGDRTLDIDILLYGDRIITAGNLEIPHPRMAGRRFVLEPLREVAPDLVHPRANATIEALAQQPEIQNQPLQQLQQPLMPAWGC